MAHQRKLGRPTDQRRAMLRNLTTSLLENGKIETTVTRAKEVQKLADKMVTLGKANTLHTKRQALGFVTKRDVVSKLFDEIAPKYSERNGGYTRVIKIGPRRGDAADPGPAAAGIGRYSTYCDRKRRNVSVFDMGRREATGYVCVRRGTTGNDAKGHRATSKDENRREWPPYDVQGQNATQNDRKRHTEGCVSFAAQYQVMPSRSCICTRRSSSSVSAAAERARPLGVTR